MIIAINPLKILVKDTKANFKNTDTVDRATDSERILKCGQK
jgi:hypothetical protein